MSWLFYILLAVCFFSISNILRKILLKNDTSDPVAYAIVYQIIVGFIILLYALIKGFDLSGYEPYVGNFILMAILYALGSMFLFKAYKITEVSITTVLFTSNTVWSIIASILILHESLSIIQIIGIVLIICSVLAVTYDKNFNLKKRRGMIYALMAAAFFGLGFANDAYIIGTRNAPSYLPFAYFLPSIAILLLTIRTKINYKEMLNTKKISRILLFSLFYAAGSMLVFIAYQSGGQASTISPIMQTATIITIILAMVFLKEKDKPGRKLLATGLAFLGVVLTVI